MADHETMAGAASTHHAAVPALPADEVDPGWVQSVSYVHAHYVRAGTERGFVYARPVGPGICDRSQGFIDERGLREAELLVRCRACQRELTGEDGASHG